jgi:anhydro-N-acetylmuramic acid kinase
MRQVYAGVMSGTSLDGVDAVIADFAPDAGRVCRVLGAAHTPFAQSLRDELLALQRAGDNELARAARAGNALADAYAAAILAAVASAGISQRRAPPASTDRRCATAGRGLDAAAQQSGARR